MKFYYANWVDQSTTVITASSQNSALPVTNVANSLRKRLYMSGSEDTTTIVFDLGGAQQNSDIILLDIDVGDNVPDYTVYSSTDGSTWTSRATFTHSGASGSTQAVSWSPVTARYWKVVINRDYDTNPITIGRIFLGQPYSTTETADYDGATFSPTDPSNTVASAGGQEYTDVKEHYDLVDLKFSDCPKSQCDTFSTIFAANGTGTPLFLLIENGFAKIYYVKFARNPKFQVSSFDSDYRFNTTLNFKEQI